MGCAGGAEQYQRQDVLRVSDLCGWEGRCGLLHEAVCEDISDLKAVHVYASGSPAMIYGMPMAIVKADLADAVYGLDDIGRHLVEACI